MECHYISSLPYHKFSEHLHREAAKKRIPLGGIFEITYRCNLHCVHCYCNLSVENCEERKRELPYNQFCKIIDEIAHEGCFWLLITGGEPLVREDFLDIYAYAKKKGMMIILFTNGVLLNEEIAGYFNDFPPFLVEITLYSMHARIHDAITGVPGSLEKTLKGIELLQRYNIRFNLKSTIHELNKLEIARMQEYAKSLNLNFRFDPMLNPRYDSSMAPCFWRLTPQEVIELDLCDQERTREWREFCKIHLPADTRDQRFTCGAGISTFCLNPYGQLQICQMMTHRGYDARSLSFRKIWFDLFPEILSLKPSPGSKCHSCQIEPLCNSCPGWAQLENGNEDSPVEFLCEVAHLREEHFWSRGGEK